MHVNVYVNKYGRLSVRKLVDKRLKTRRGGLKKNCEVEFKQSEIHYDLRICMNTKIYFIK